MNDFITKYRTGVTQSIEKKIGRALSSDELKGIESIKSCMFLQTYEMTLFLGSQEQIDKMMSFLQKEGSK